MFAKFQIFEGLLWPLFLNFIRRRRLNGPLLDLLGFAAGKNVPVMAVKTLDFPMCSFLNQSLPLKQLFAADDSTGGLDKLEVPQICGRACRIFSGRASTERAGEH